MGERALFSRLSRPAIALEVLGSFVRFIQDRVEHVFEYLFSKSLSHCHDRLSYWIVKKVCSAGMLYVYSGQSRDITCYQFRRSR